MDQPGPKVLLVDDDPVVREIYGRRLAEEGYRVLTALDAQQALDLACRENPQVIILDINLPDAGGLSVLRVLKNQEATTAIPVIMITSAPDYRMRREFAKAGEAAGFLIKPFSPKQLLAEIQKVIPMGSPPV